MLRDRQLHALVRVGTSKDDFAGQIGYVNRRGRLHWGFIGGFVPARFAGARRSVARTTSLITQEYANLRYAHEYASLTGALQRQSRNTIRVPGGWEANRLRVANDHAGDGCIHAKAGDTCARGAARCAAGVPRRDAGSRTCATRLSSVRFSPIVGHRIRLDVEPAVGWIDVRGSFVWMRAAIHARSPVTFAVRLDHTGRYGPNARDGRLTPLLLGLQTLVRGYDLTTLLRSGAVARRRAARWSISSRQSLRRDESGTAGAAARTADRQSRLRCDADGGAVFADGAMLWTPHADAPLERDRSAAWAPGMRANLGGFVLELTAVRPSTNHATGGR
jgi:hypothetical protein